MKTLLVHLSLLLVCVSTLNTTNSIEHLNYKRTISAIVSTGVPTEVAKIAYSVSLQQAYPVELIIGQIYVESTYRTDARSWANAYGLMQLRPIAIREVERLSGIQYDRYNPTENTMAGVVFMKELQKRYSFADSYKYYNGGWRFNRIPHTTVYYDRVMDKAEEVTKALSMVEYIEDDTTTPSIYEQLERVIISLVVLLMIFATMIIIKVIITQKETTMKLVLILAVLLTANCSVSNDMNNYNTGTTIPDTGNPDNGGGTSNPDPDDTGNPNNNKNVVYISDVLSFETRGITLISVSNNGTLVRFHSEGKLSTFVPATDFISNKVFYSETKVSGTLTNGQIVSNVKIKGE